MVYERRDKAKNYGMVWYKMGIMERKYIYRTTCISFGRYHRMAQNIGFKGVSNLSNLSMQFSLRTHVRKVSGNRVDRLDSLDTFASTKYMLEDIHTL